MNWSRALLVGLPSFSLLAWGGYVVLFGTEVATAIGEPILCNATTHPVDERCDFQVRMERSGLIGCVANSDYSSIEIGTKENVGTRFSPKLVWTIKKPDVSITYRFRDDGIRIKDAFDRAEDLDDNGHEDVGRTKYRWKSLNKRFKELHFDPQVQRKVSLAWLDFWVDCEPKDPLIVNAGN